MSVLQSSVESLIILGSGGFARETAAAVRAINDHRPRFELLGFADDDNLRHGLTFEGASIIGPIDEMVRLNPNAKFVVCTGSPINYTSRRRIVGRLGLDASCYATVIHPSASVPASAMIGVGSVLLANVVLTSECVVGDHVAVMPQVVITHDDQINSFATMAAGVKLGGSVVVGQGAYLGAGALVRENRTIGAWSLVGMGSIVTCAVPPGEVWMGAPARRYRTADIAGDLLRESELDT